MVRILSSALSFKNLLISHANYFSVSFLSLFSALQLVF